MGVVHNMKNRELNYISEAYQQKNRPICGIYSFLNGMIFDKCSASYVSNLADELWKKALIEKAEVGSQQSYSIVGEFFNSKRLADFLRKVIEDYASQLKITGQSKPEITLLDTANELKDGEINSGVFYLIPLSAKAFGINKNNIHWICLKGNQILNSNKGLKKICCADSREEMVRRYKNLPEEDVCFDLKKWVRHRNRQYIDLANEKIKDIKKSSTCCCKYCKNDLSIIKVKLNNQ